MIATCPSSDSLKKYALGDLAENVAGEIETHLVDCPACEETIAQFDSADDTLIRHLPLAAGSGDVTSDSPGWMERLRNQPAHLQDVAAHLAPGDSPGVNPGDNANETFAVDSATNFNAYELLGVLGRGGMGVVYRARHRQLNRNVALKVLSPRLTAAPEARRRFEREIQVLGGLHHPGIVMATDAGRVAGAAYLVMELVDGVDLARLVRQGGPLSIAEACSTGQQIAEALSAAHEAGAVHRDVKPSNVMVDRRGRAKLLDFGLAHFNAVSAESMETSVGRLLGTLDYMAPEQAAGTQSPNAATQAAADLYGLGATLFYLLTGQPPHGSHQGRTLVQQLRSIVDAQVPRVRTLRADVPPELDDFLAALLTSDPTQRPASAEAIAERLKQWAGGNLSARVNESSPLPLREGPGEGSPPGANHAPDETASDSGEQALRSLSELVGPDILRLSKSQTRPDEALHSASTMLSPTKSNGGRFRTLRYLAAAAAFAAVLYGIVITLKTPDGTLTIVSDADNMQVAVTDTKDATNSKELTVSRDGKNLTTLKAGQYEVRFTGEHDGFKFDKDTITLERGQNAVARITRTNGTKVDSTAAPPTTSPTTISQSAAPARDRLYSGKSEAEWRRIFLAETERNAKFEAGAALVTFISALPPDRQVEELLNMGEEYFRVTYAGRYMQSALQTWNPTPSSNSSLASQSNSRGGRGGNRGFGGGQFGERGGGGEGGGGRNRGVSPTSNSSGFGNFGTPPASRGSAARGGGSISGTAASFLPGLRQLASELPADTLVGPLCAVAVGPNEPRAGFALAVLRAQAPRITETSPAAAQIVARVLREQEAMPVSLDRSDVLMLVRGKYISHAAEAQRQEWLAALKKVVERLTTYDFQPQPQSLILDQLMRDAQAGGNLWPVELRERFAQLIRSVLYNFGGMGSRGDGLAYFYLTDSEFSVLSTEMEADGPITPPYDRRYVAATRQKLSYFLDQWLPMVNRDLESWYERVGDSLDGVLALYSDGDDWPVDKTAEALTKRLQQQYGTPGSAKLLAQIVSITGQLPELPPVREKLNSRVAAQLELLPPFLAGDRDRIGSDPFGYFAGLYDLIPVEVIRLAVSEAKHVPIRSASMVFTDPLTPRNVLNLASCGGTGFDGRRAVVESYIDPVLLLAVLSKLTGESEAQDGRIAQLMKEESTGFTTVARSPGYPLELKIAQGLKIHLKNLLSSNLKAREHARAMLSNMEKNAKSPALLAAIKEIRASESSPAEKVGTSPDKSATAPPATSATTDKTERLYNGRSESEWQKLFTAETQVTAKYAAAEALISLAAQKPPEAQLEQILFVGEGCARAMYGPTDVLCFAFEDVGFPQGYFPMGARGTRRGSRGAPTQRGARVLPPEAQLNRVLLEQIVGTLESQPLETYVAPLCKAATTGSDARAAFALRLIMHPWYRKLRTNPAATQIVLRELKMPLTGVDRSAACLLVRAGLLEYAAEGEQTAIFDSLTDLADKLVGKNNPASAAIYKGALLDVIHDAKSLPLKLQTSAAELVLDDLRDERPRAIGEYFSLNTSDVSSLPAEAGGRSIVPPYDSNYKAAIRNKTNYFVNAWLPTVNRQLANRQTVSPFTGELIKSLDKVVPLYSEGDNWPAAATANILTERLRVYYSPDAKSNQTTDELLSASPAVMLTQIVRITGKIPDFARTGHPLPQEVQDKLKAFETFLASEREEFQPYPPNRFAGLYDVAPLEVIKLCLADTKELPRGYRGYRTLPTRMLLISTSTGSNVTMAGGVALSGQPESFVDPLLLLAALTNLTGANEAQDSRIAQLLTEFSTGWSGPGGPSDPEYQMRSTGLANHLRFLVSSQLKAREFALAMLSQMEENAKSPALLAAIKEIRAGELTDAQKTGPGSDKSDNAPPATSATSNQSQRLYKGQPVTAWPGIFAAETDPAARLEAAAAVLHLLPEQIGEEEMATILSIGENIVRDAYGDDCLLFAFETDNQPPRATRWDLAPREQSSNIVSALTGGTTTTRSNSTLRDTYQLYLNELNARLAKVPSELLASELSDAAVKGSDARAAFALSLLRGAARQNIEANPAAAQTVVSKLKSPSRAVDRSAVWLITRANYASKSPERRDTLTEIAKLAESVLDAPRGVFRDAVRSELLSFGESTNAWPEEAFRQDWPAPTRKIFARLVIDEMTGSTRQQPGRMYVYVSDQLPAEETVDGIRNAVTRLLPGYDPRYPAARRTALRYFLDEFLPVANEYLTSHAGAPYDEATKFVFYAASAALNARLPDDNWPADATAAVITEQLRRYYVADASNQTDQAASDPATAELAPLQPENFLDTIAAITGDVPDFARTQLPKSKTTANRLTQFEAALGGELDSTARLQQLEGTLSRGRGGRNRGLVRSGGFANLYADAPFQVIKLAVRETTARLPVDRSGFGGRSRGNRSTADGQPRDYLIQPTDVLLYATTGPGGASRPTADIVDPMFLLAALAKLTGESEAQDARIADLLRGTLPYYSGSGSTFSVSVQLRSLIGGPTQTGRVARELLTSMAAKTKNEALVEAVRRIDATLVKAPESKEPVPTATIRTKLWDQFVAEKDPAQKLDLAEQLLAHAASISAEQQIEESLNVGEEIVRASFGADTFKFALTSSSPPSNSPNWPLKDRDEPAFVKYDSYLRFLTAVYEQVPAQPLAQKLAGETVSNSSARAAYALWALRTVAYPRIIADPAASQVAFKNLALPLADSNWSNLILICRWYFAKQPPADELSALFKSLNSLAGRLHESPRADVTKQLTHMLQSGFYRFRVIHGNATPIPADLQKSMAVLFLDDTMRQTEEHIGYFSSAGGNGRIVSIFQAKHVDWQRKQWGHFLDQWFPAVNDYLEKHPSPPFDASTKDVNQAVYNTVLLYADGDQWPVDRTAQLLTDSLRKYYTGEVRPSRTMPTDVLPTSAAEMLASIVHITGRIPEFARDEIPKLPRIAEQLGQWERFVSAKPDDETRKSPSGRMIKQNRFVFSTRLAQDAPYQAVEIALREAAVQQPPPLPPRSSGFRGSGGRPYLPTPGDLLAMVSPNTIRTVDMDRAAMEDVRANMEKYQQNPGALRERLPTADIDAVLLLAILDDLTGKDEARDARIATLFVPESNEATPWRKNLFVLDLKELLASPLKAREHAKRMLTEMTAKSKSPALVESIRGLDASSEK